MRIGRAGWTGQGECLPLQNQGPPEASGQRCCAPGSGFSAERPRQPFAAVSNEAPGPRAKLLSLQGDLKTQLVWALGGWLFPEPTSELVFLSLSLRESPLCSPLGALPCVSESVLGNLTSDASHCSVSSFLKKSASPRGTGPCCPCLPASCKPPEISEGKFLRGWMLEGQAQCTPTPVGPGAFPEGPAPWQPFCVDTVLR